MFLGTYEPKLDDKGRLILPSKYRDDLADGLVITRGQDRCLYVFPQEEFARMYQELRRAPLASKQARDFIRVMLSGALDDKPDKQGRITIPVSLRQYAGLSRDLAVIGAGSRVEIWSRAAWQQYLEGNEQAFSDTAEEVIPGLF
ncbi:MAG: division/cell wall cluster transcriptional repressor MraZ [Actinomycetaceae bacterium]|nr:division/cell wall cluster transcriptional repressor MraZ [Actinomycetaceae bacterium]